MRKVSQTIINAFLANAEAKHGNSSVTIENDPSVGRVVYLKLHGNKIARKPIGSPTFEISNAGWFSNTTKERLNGLPGVSINQKNFEWFLNGSRWNGEWISI